MVALRGTLGAGKTVLVRGIARGMQLSDEVTSPTYTIVNEYAMDDTSPPLLYHVDLYRLHSADEFALMGGEEIMFGGPGVAVIEWSEKIDRMLPPDCVRISIEIVEPAARRLTIREDDGEDPGI